MLGINEHAMGPLLFFLFLVTLIIVAFSIFYIASKLAGEDFDTAVYALVTIFITMMATVVFVVIGTVFQALIYRGVFETISILLVNSLLFMSYCLFIMLSTLGILHHTFMYIRTRVIVSMLYATVIGAMLAFLGGSV